MVPARRSAAALAFLAILLAVVTIGAVAAAEGDPGMVLSTPDATTTTVPDATTTTVPDATTTTVPDATTTTVPDATTTTLPAAAVSLTITVWARGEPAGTAPGPSLEAGTELDWAYDVTNPGPGDLWALYLWHDGAGKPECPDRSLAPGETVRCTLITTAVDGAQADAVRAWAWDDTGAEAEGASVAHYVGVTPVIIPAPAIDLEAFVNGKDADRSPGPVIAPGEAVRYRYRVHNTGNVTLWGVSVRDTARGVITCPRRSLTPGERMFCTIWGVAAEGAQAAAAEARGADAAGSIVEDQDLLHYFGAAPVPGLEIEALVEGFDGDSPPGPRVRRPGAAIRFTYLVANTGGVPVTDVQVTDDAVGAVRCPRSTLVPGASMTCRASAVARLGEFASAGRVTARAGDAVLADADPIYYHVRQQSRIHHLTLEVTVDGRDADDAASAPSIPVGGAVRLVYLVTYTGNNIVYNVTIQDPFVAPSLLSCDGDRILQSGETLRCTAAVLATAGPFASMVTAVSWDADGRRVSAEDWVHYYGMA